MKKRSVIKEVMFVFSGVLVGIIAMLILCPEVIAETQSLPNIYGNGYNMRIYDLVYDDVLDSGATGLGDILAISSLHGDNNIKVSVNMRNLPVQCGKVFEMWLVNHKLTEKLYLGKFSVSKTGKKCVSFSKKQVNFLLYDHVYIVQRSTCGEDQVVLIGDFSKDP